MFLKDKKKKKFQRKKRELVSRRGCRLCQEKAVEVDYKDLGKIRRFVSGRGKILSSKLTGICSKHQKFLTRGIKRARYMGFFPFVQG